MKARKTFLILFIFLLSALFLSSASGEQKEICILYLNDFHGFAEPYKPYGSSEELGGIAWLSAKVNALRKDKPCLLLAAGDMIQGNNWANLSQGESVTELMNTMKFDAMVTGNHEFDFGQTVLKQRVSEVIFPVLAANVEGIDSLKPYAIRDISGLRVGIIGVVTEDTPVSTHPRNVAGIKFIPASDAVKKYLAELRGKTDLLILLSHTGHANDRSLAENISGIDIIVGGHSHTKVTSPVKVNNTLILQAWEHGKVLGVLNLVVENGKIVKSDGYLEEIKPVSGQEDPSVMTIVEKYRQKVDAILDRTAGTAMTDLDGENFRVRTEETNLGNFVADIMREASGADATIINSGGLRTSIKKGEIKIKHVYSVLPFDNYIVAIKLTGKQIKEALEHGVSAVEKGEGRFPQISGISFQYNPSAGPGERVHSIKINGNPLEPEKQYSVATNDFLAAGGDGYKVFGEAVRSSSDYSVIGGAMKGEKLVYSDSGRWLRDVVIEYIIRKKEINPAKEGRISVVTD